MRQIVLEPIIADNEVPVQFTSSVEIDKKLEVRVPGGYQAVVLIDEKVSFRIPQTAGKKLAECGKEYLGKGCRVAFVRTNVPLSMAWGFGNIQVKNDRLQEAYRVGANGLYTLEITEVARLIRHFGTDGKITADQIREKTMPAVRSIGTTLLGKMFANSGVAVFDLAQHTSSFRENLLQDVQKEGIFAELGVTVKDLTVSGIHVNEEDLERIRARVNNGEAQETANAGGREDAELFLEQLRKTQAEITESLKTQVQQQLDAFRSVLMNSMEDKMQDLLPLPEKAQPEYVEQLHVTAEFLIENAKDEEDYILAAAMIYTDVEKNLIRFPGMRYENHTFVMDYADYLALAERTKIGDEYLLKRKNGKTGAMEPLMPRVVRRAPGGKPELVEMIPLVRFLSVGMEPSVARNAAEKWMILNKIRHRSPDSVEYLNDYFKNNFVSEKEYLSDTLAFFKAKNLYTKE